MIRTPKKLRTKKRKIGNPGVSDLVKTKIEPKKGRYDVLVFVGPDNIRTYEGISSKRDAQIAADVAKSTLIRELKSIKRSNPDYELDDSLQRAIGKSIALPDDKMEAFELGRLVGTQECLNRYSGILNFWERRKALKAVDKAIKNALGELTRTILVRGEGIQGPVPFVKKSTKS